MAAEQEGDNQVPLTLEQRGRAQRFAGYVARWKAGSEVRSSKFAPLLRRPEILDDATVDIARCGSDDAAATRPALRFAAHARA